MTLRHVDLIMPAHNEAAGIGRSLDSAYAGLQELDDSGVTATIRVIANGCADETADVAARWARERISGGDSGRVGFALLELADRQKLAALNAGIDAGEGDITLAMDSDGTVDSLAVTTLVDMLLQDRPLGASLYHAADPHYVPRTPLGDVVVMGDLRRETIPKRWKMHGGFMGWNSRATLNGEPVRFPDGTPVPDDTWLSFALVAQHGLDAVFSERNGVYSRYIPPRTEEDFLAQRSRFEVSDELVARVFPDLAATIKEVQSLNPRHEEILEKWIELCKQSGIPFEERIEYYDHLRAIIASRREATIGRLLAQAGVWEQVATARIGEIEA